MSPDIVSPEKCTFCFGERLRPFRAREMMFGTRHEVDYGECQTCGSVQVARMPSPNILAAYYPEEYYAFSGTSPRSLPLQRTGITARIVRLRNAVHEMREDYATGGSNFVGSLIFAVKPPPTPVSLIRRLRLVKNARILDVGCGDGRLLDILAKNGFTRLAGIDPFINDDFETSRGVPIYKRDLALERGEFDVVMLNHSFEHLTQPFECLTEVHRLLSREGRCIVRTPTTSSYAWRRFGKDWVQLDAPRHIHIASREGIRMIGERCSLTLIDVIDDSTSFQFWGSELYAKDVPLTSHSRLIDRPNNCGPILKRVWLAMLSRYLNMTGHGDQAAFVFSKV